MAFQAFLVSSLPLQKSCSGPESVGQGSCGVCVTSQAPALTGLQDADIKQTSEGLSGHFAWSAGTSRTCHLQEDKCGLTANLPHGPGEERAGTIS